PKHRISAIYTSKILKSKAPSDKRISPELTMQGIQAVEQKVAPVVTESLFISTEESRECSSRHGLKRQRCHEPPLEGAVCLSQGSTEHVSEEPCASSSTLCKKAARAAAGREAEPGLAGLALPPLENKPGFLERSSLPAGRPDEAQGHGLIPEAAGSLSNMGNQDGKLKKNAGEAHEGGEDASGPRDADSTKKGAGSKKGLGRHSKGSESGKKKGKSESRASVFSNLRIRKNLSKAKDGNSSSKEDVLESQASQTGELDSAHSILTKTPDISISADEGGLSDTDVEHFENTNEAPAAAAQPQDGQRTSSGSDTDIYSFHSATEQEDLLSDIQQAIRLQLQQQGAINTGTEQHGPKTMDLHMANSQAAPLDLERFLSFSSEKDSSPETEQPVSAKSEITDYIPAGDIESEVKGVTNGRGQSCSSVFDAQEEPRQLSGEERQPASELQDVSTSDAALSEKGALQSHSVFNFPSPVGDSETEGTAVEFAASEREGDIADTGHTLVDDEAKDGKWEASASRGTLDDGFTSEMKNGTLSSEDVSSSLMHGSKCLKPYPPINPCYIKTTTRQLSSPNHSPCLSPSQSPLFKRRRESPRRKECVPTKKQRSSSLAGPFSRSADWTEDVSDHRGETARKSGSADFLEYRQSRDVFKGERLPLNYLRKSSGIPPSADSFPNVFRGRTLLEKLSSQQENAPQEEAEKLCSWIIAMGLLLPFSDCFREPCSQSVQQSVPTFDQDQLYTWAAVNQPTHSSDYFEGRFPRRIPSVWPPPKPPDEEQKLNHTEKEDGIAAAVTTKTEGTKDVQKVQENVAMKSEERAREIQRLEQTIQDLKTKIAELEKQFPPAEPLVSSSGGGGSSQSESRWPAHEGALNAALQEEEPCALPKTRTAKSVQTSPSDDCLTRVMPSANTLPQAPPHFPGDLSQGSAETMPTPETQPSFCSEISLVLSPKRISLPLDAAPEPSGPEGALSSSFEDKAAPPASHPTLSTDSITCSEQPPSLATGLSTPLPGMGGPSLIPSASGSGVLPPSSLSASGHALSLPGTVPPPAPPLPGKEIPLPPPLPGTDMLPPAPSLTVISSPPPLSGAGMQTYIPPPPPLPEMGVPPPPPPPPP
ncbi:hypothetical protein JRQ81_008777, partial [Phrynocephalus forsythii]